MLFADVLSLHLVTFLMFFILVIYDSTILHILATRMGSATPCRNRVLSMAATFGSIGEFEEGKDWPQNVECLTHFFAAMGLQKTRRNGQCFCQ